MSLSNPSVEIDVAEQRSLPFVLARMIQSSHLRAETESHRHSSDQGLFQQPASGTFVFSLSSTTAPVALNAGTGLNVSNLSANVGSDNTVVYSGPLPAISGGMLTINFTTPFSFNVSTSNLLLDVQSSDATVSSRCFFALDEPNSPGQGHPRFSRVWIGFGDDETMTRLGLVTTFLY